ncbi:MAG: type IV pilus modification protein PilV [Burkholderiales bacterium]|nr:type IV pilus modification protein PilV [Burkholderiales bacterium]
MLEVLVTIVILAFGMLGLAGLQSKIFSAEMESYQRAQAVLLMNDMVERINANRGAAATYASSPATMGTGDAQPADCSGVAAGVARDKCEWSNKLKGAAETSGSTKVGAMVGALGCISVAQAENAALGVCTPGIYLVTVAWQGLTPTSTPSASCGTGTYGSDERMRRAISARVAIGLPSCQ